jgi:hypothetical protein
LKFSSFSTAIREAFSFPVLLGTFLAAAALSVASFKLADSDMWWHVAVGKDILATAVWPTTDPYSFTARGTDWIAYEWLGEVAMAEAARLGGLVGLAALLGVLAATFMILLYYCAYLRSGNSKAAFVACFLIFFLAAGFFTLRPQLLGYIFLLVTLITLEHFRQGHPRAIWVLPGLFLLWVNTHGTFTFGLLALALTWASGLVARHLSFVTCQRHESGSLCAETWNPPQRRQLLFVMLCSVLVLPLTPYGTRVAAYPLRMALSQPINISSISEWQPLGASGEVLKLFLAFFLPFLLAQIIWRPVYRLEEMVLLLFATYMACEHSRFLILFVVIFAPLLAMLLARWVPQYEQAKDRATLNAALVTLIVLVVAAKLLPRQKDLERDVAKAYPQGAVEYLRAHPLAGPMLNEYGWGGYLIWAMGQESSVFIDGRADVYEYAGILSDYFRIMRLDRETLPLLRKYRVKACLIERESPLATLLAALPHWRRSYSDDLSVLFEEEQESRSQEPAARRNLAF